MMSDCLNELALGFGEGIGVGVSLGEGDGSRPKQNHVDLDWVWLGVRRPGVTRRHSTAWNLPLLECGDDGGGIIPH